MKVGHFRLRRRGDLFTRSREAPLGYLEFAGWMAPGILWLDGWLTSDSQEPVEVTLKVGGEERQAVRAERFSYSRPDLAEIPGATGQVLALPLEQPVDGRRIEALYVRQNGAWYRWTSRRGKPIHSDLIARLRHKLSVLPEIRPDLGSFITDRCAQALPLDGSLDPLFHSPAAAVEDSAAAAEETTAEVGEEQVAGGDGEPTGGDPPPPFMADPTEPLGLCIDDLVATGGDSFFVKGWIWDVHAVVEELELVYPGGQRRELLGSVVRAERPDVTNLFRPEFGDSAEGRHGFFGFFETGVPKDPRHCRFELRISDGESVAAGTPPLITCPLPAREAIFGSLPDMRYRDLELLSGQIHPANEGVRSRSRERVAVCRSFEYGGVPSAPEMSLVIPVFEHVELVEHQLAQLSDDPGLGDCEVIFVLDSRRDAAWLEEVVFHLSRLYRVPVRGLVLSHRGGHAVATNVGAAHARGRLLVLMSADVFPDRPGWLEVMAEFYGSRPDIGVLGPKLLYEDQSVRHAGLYFAKGLEPDDLWSTGRFYHGLPRRHPAAEATRRVPALSGACLMIRRDLFERLGGLRDVYFGTDFEDADLCLRCAEEGLESWYLPSAELFHLEGLSPKSESEWHHNPWTRLYDRWLQDHRWDETIRTVMEESNRPVQSIDKPSKAKT